MLGLQYLEEKLIVILLTFKSPDSFQAAVNNSILFHGFPIFQKAVVLVLLTFVFQSNSFSIFFLTACLFKSPDSGSLLYLILLRSFITGCFVVPGLLCFVRVRIFCLQEPLQRCSQLLQNIRDLLLSQKNIWIGFLIGTKL